MAGKWDIKLLPPSFAPWEPNTEPTKQIAVLMSGGVDSSVAASLLKEQGWKVLGITMKIPVPAARLGVDKLTPAKAGAGTSGFPFRKQSRNGARLPLRRQGCDTGKRSCCGADAAFVCNELNIPHYFVDVTKPFGELIIKPFRQSYASGQTPNPCVDCNTLLKFSLLWDFLKQTFGIAYLATGHYAKVTKADRQTYLGRAKDKTKDQSYFLYGIALEKLARFILPLGELTKKKVRSIATNSGLTVAEKAESMELCFAGEGDYRTALTNKQTNHAGDITDMQGNKIATHKGVANYTLGQRQGIGFAGGKPLYVGKIDAQTNTIALGTREQVSSHTIRASQVNVLIPEEFVTGSQVFGKIRSYGNPKLCKLIDANKTVMTVEFDQPQFAPCPGQRLVLYNSDYNIIAGGTIY